MIPLGSETPGNGTITRIPYDILREIFVHCLPRHPFKHGRQPNTTIAPMLLCHICSSWRAAALASATLWSHLSYSLTLYSKDGIKYDLIRQDAIVFLRWWRKNNGLMAPYLRLRVQNRDDRNWELDTLSEIAFLLEYIFSAQYLSLAPFYWSLIQEEIAGGYQFAYPNLHTLVEPSSAEDYSFYRIQALMAPHSAPMLRHFAAHNYDIRVPKHTSLRIPVQWSKLTHFSLSNIEISLEFWFFFIRAVPDLQWGYLGIYSLYDAKDYTKPAQPAQYTLHKLSTFFLELKADMEEHSFSLFFLGLHLPALHTLSLSSDRELLWYDHRAIDELYKLIQSTPALITLALGESFLCLDENEYSTVHLPAIRHVEPIWSHVPHLVELQLASPDLRLKTINEVEEKTDIFFENITFPDKSWLDLRNTACPIRTITIFNSIPLSNRWGDDFTDLMMSTLKEHIEKVPNIDFQIASDSAVLKAPEVRHEWGSRT